ncbi:U3 small nucleolar RNA-associated protein, putative [Candida dubliniensis CD36]|uniref:U3 small nucleolar RNA-associated protein, putative n=1 Tax=Candida dubliniensis (strain CD36 / ATCC MYA-646 / CBS 7987 / NCPF 3949 / NRRL Y-17841) TaxID=573826 RepID=B9WD89_CANDC|nr:U3 small nucleolar RNA-associated protein, putative [Candida dubliniensis CD36]CAX42639.1 U3 small nucleolar RNA-associated protein, putative [Candida dubliniensis CD36]
MSKLRTKTTESSRRHAFSSFRERVDSIKIEPSKKLTKRVYDYIDTEDQTDSYFLTTLEHWKETNLSGNFTEFLNKIEQNCQSLPQLIYHQSTIYQALYDAIAKNDVHSIQPLLELMSQFIHDLGSDFLPFYTKTLKLLMDLVLSVNPNDFQNNRNSSNVLEWAFNTLAFAFKYLSRNLAIDLKPTFIELLPLLQLTKKTYISRFCAEALSFLIRKSNQESLNEIIQFSLYDQIDIILDNDAYCESLTILYSEAMKNTKGTFHSKANLIFSKIMENTLYKVDTKAQPKLISIISDIILDILNHGTVESCDKFYAMVTDYLNNLLEKHNADPSEIELLTTCQILSTLAFAESGKKISNWDIVLETVDLLVAKINCNNNATRQELLESYIYLLVIVFRNADIQSLTIRHKKYFDSIYNTSEFLTFTEASLSIAKSKVINFGIIKLLQNYINNCQDYDKEVEKLTYFLNNNDISSKLQIPQSLVSQISNQINKDIKSKSFKSIHWKLLLLNFANNFQDINLQSLKELLFNLESGNKNLAAITLDIISHKLKEFPDSQTHIDEITSYLETNFHKFDTSTKFLNAINNYIKVTKSGGDFLSNAITCLHYPTHELRTNAIELISTLVVNESSTYLSQIRLIEQIPLNISTGRDITLRIRNLAMEFSKEINPSDLDKKLIVNYFFGLLSNKFQPSWTAVYESLPLISSTCKSEIWQVAYKLLTLDYTNDEDEDEENTEERSVVDFPIESTLIDWQPRNSRLLNNFESFENSYLAPYRNISQAINNNLERNAHFDSMVRSHVLNALKTIPSIVEKNAGKLIPIITHQPTIDEDELQNWSRKDRNELLELFAKFKNLRKIPESEELYDYLLDYLLTSKYVKVQQLALDVLFTWNNPSINKYKDNLKNLLDDAIFSDEISNFIINGTNISTSNIIEPQDKPLIMKFVIRILFGRVQGSPKSNSKQGKKFAVISVLPSLTNSEIISFIELGANKIGYEGFFNGQIPKASLGLDQSELKKISGFINLLSEIYHILGANYNAALQTTIKPLIFSLVSAQNRIESTSLIDSIISEKMAKNIRSNGMRCLTELFTIIGDDFDWNDYLSLIYDNLINPRMETFADENLQQPSAMLKLISFWIGQSNTLPFLYIDEFATTRAILSLLSKSSEAKESVITLVLDFTINALERKDNEIDEKYFTLLAFVVDSLLQYLPQTIEMIYNKEVGSRAIKVLLLLISGKYIEDQDTKASLIKSLTIALEKNNNQIDLDDKANILVSLSSLIDEYDCEFHEIQPLYEIICKLFKMFATRNVRETLVVVINTMGNKFKQIEPIAPIITGLNAYSDRMSEYDFEKRLEAYRLVNEEMYKDLTPIQWLPLLYCALFFINDRDELAIRVNAGYMLRRFVDCYSSIIIEPKEYVHLLKDIVLPNLKIGIRKENEDVQTEYILVLEHIVKHSVNYTELNDMKVLIGQDDEEGEDNFFQSINHIQLHRRQRAIRRLRDYKDDLKDNSISHYILPIIEGYVTTKEDKHRNIGLEALETIGVLLKSVTWNQYKAIVKRYISNLNKSQDTLKQRVNLMVAVSFALAQSVKENNKNLPEQQQELDQFILYEISPPLLKLLQIRDDETIVARAPLAEALTNFMLCITKDKIDGELPKILTSTCQVMRSRSEELRDAVRKTLGKIAISLGPNYLSFIFKELKTALSRGSQIHVLSFTVHYLLTCVTSILQHSDLDDCIEIVIGIVMEDIFGAAGQEKDAEGYTSKMKEVKFKKSFDTAEIVASNVSLNQFGTIIEPIKLLLQEMISHKTQVKLDELLRRLSFGLNHNQEASNIEILHLCYEIYMMSKENDEVNETKVSAKEQHFLTTLDRKVKKRVDKSLYKQTMQRLSFELLRTAISRHDNLMSVTNLQGFIPLLEEGVKSENETVIIASLKILNIIIRLPFPDQGIFKACARRTLILIKDSPSTNSDICQAALKFLATTIRHNPEVTMKESAISYVLTRIQPDLEEPNKQGLAFNFLKAVVSQHIMIPEIYDLMDNVAKLMIVNHSKEIRDMSRSVYFQFLMEYDQGKGRLEKQFKYLVSNLTYPTEEGRQSIMELIHLIVVKAGKDLLNKLSSSFFVALANVLISDVSSRCREMASSLITTILKKLDDTSSMEKYCSVWIKQSTNSLLKRCGLNIYKLIITVRGFGKNKELDKIALDNILNIIEAARNTKDEQDSAGTTTTSDDVEWELVYSCLSTFSSMASIIKDRIFEYRKIWNGIINILLFPHSWIRLITCRLMTILLSNGSGDIEKYDLQNIATKLIHQLRAPSITSDLGTQITKNLVLIAMKWEKETYEWDGNLANDYLLSKICGIIKSEHVHSIESKKSCIKLTAMFIQFTNQQRIIKISEMIISALYNYTDPTYATPDDELTNLSLEALELVQEKIGTSEYTKLYSNIKVNVNVKRQERKAKRAQMAISAPDIAAKRKLKKHERVREKRKHEKDINGYYKPKKKRTL